jgi:methylglutaconyl-CoA hydratase
MTNLLNLTTNDHGIATLTLNRPEVHNAFNAELIAELSATFDRIADDGTRALVLTGAGHSFSAGADLNWMRSMAKGSEADNRADARRLASMLRKLDHCPARPLRGSTAMLLVAGSDWSRPVATLRLRLKSAQFGLTEVRLGLAPATISPFVIQKIGVQHSRRYMLTGERMDSATAVRIGLITDRVPNGQLDSHVHDFIDLLLAGGPQAQARAKDLIRTVTSHSGDSDELDQQTSAMIAALRVSPEGQEGLSAFLEKRRPAWVGGEKVRREEGRGKREGT